MAAPNIPSTMRAWQYWNTNGGLENSLKLKDSVNLPQPKDNEHLVRVIATALNPIDYKPAEIPLVGRFAITKPATPGIDFVGQVVKPAPGSSLKPGQLIHGFDCTNPLAGSALREYTTAKANQSAPIPAGLKPVEAVTIGVAAITAYQSIVPHVTKGSNLFINGGSGGCGVFGIQFAKEAGCHVTTTCSTPNIDLCKSLGADEVIDYKKQNVAGTLISSGRKFDHVVDNTTGPTATELRWRGHEFLKEDALYVAVAGDFSLNGLYDTTKRRLLPKFLGGIKTNSTGFWPKPSMDDLVRMEELVSEGKVKPVIDSEFKFEDAPKAIERLKTGRAKGKIIVHVSEEES